MGVFLIFVAIEAWLVLLRPAGLVSAHPLVRRFVAQAESQGQNDISQSFRMGPHGFRGVTVYPVATGSIGGGNVTLELWEAAEGDPARSDLPERLVRRVVTGVSTLLRDTQFIWTFDPIDESAGRRYRLLTQLPKGLGLQATRIRRQPIGVFFAVDRPVWGSLIFDTTATRSTVAQRVFYELRHHHAWPAGLILFVLVVVGHLAFLGLLLYVTDGKPGMDTVTLDSLDSDTGQTFEMGAVRRVIKVGLALLLVGLCLEAAARVKTSVQLRSPHYLLYHDFITPVSAPPAESFVREVQFVPAELPSTRPEVVAFGGSVMSALEDQLSRQLRGRDIPTEFQNANSTPESAERHSVAFTKNSLILIEDMLLPAAYDTCFLNRRPLLQAMEPQRYWFLYRNSALFLWLDERLSLRTEFVEDRIRTFADEPLLRLEETIRNSKRTGARMILLIPPNALVRSGERTFSKPCGIAVDAANRRLRTLLGQYGVRYVDLYGDHNDTFAREDFSDPIHLNPSGSRKAVDLILKTIAADLRD